MKSAVVLLGLLAGFPAAAGDLHAEIMHAEYSSEAPNLEDAHVHLQHSLNCVVVPGGEGFDAAGASRGFRGAGKRLFGLRLLQHRLCGVAKADATAVANVLQAMK